MNNKSYKKLYLFALGMLLALFCCSCQYGQKEEVPEITTLEKSMNDMAAIPPKYYFCGTKFILHRDAL